MKWLFLIGFWVWVIKGAEITRWLEVGKRQTEEEKLAYREHIKEIMETD